MSAAEERSHQQTACRSGHLPDSLGGLRFGDSVRAWLCGTITAKTIDD